jgi:hypothetical protein
VAKVFIIFSSHCPAGFAFRWKAAFFRRLAVFTVQRTVPLSAGIPLVLVDIKLLAKIMPSVTITLLFIQKCMSNNILEGFLDAANAASLQK